MKFTIICFALFVLSYDISGQQSAKQAAKQKATMEADANKFAQDLCACTDKIINQYHPAIVALMKDMSLYGEEEAQKKFEQYLMSATPADMEKVQVDIGKMEAFGEEYQLKCINLLATENAKYQESEEFENLLMEKLKSLKDCAFTYQLMQLGGQQ